MSAPLDGGLLFGKAVVVSGKAGMASSIWIDNPFVIVAIEREVGVLVWAVKKKNCSKTCQRWAQLSVQQRISDGYGWGFGKGFGIGQFEASSTLV